MRKRKNFWNSIVISVIASIIASLIVGAVVNILGIVKFKESLDERLKKIDNIEKDVTKIRENFFNAENEGYSIKVGYSKDVQDGTAVVFVDNSLNLKKTEEIILRDPADVNLNATVKVVIIKEIKRNKGQEEDIYVSENSLKRLGIDRVNKRLFQGVFDLRLKKCFKMEDKL